jgi:hypothetical protein
MQLPGFENAVPEWRRNEGHHEHPRRIFQRRDATEQAVWNLPINVKEAARFLGVSQQTVIFGLSESDSPPPRMGRIRFLRSDLEPFARNSNTRWRMARPREHDGVVYRRKTAMFGGCATGTRPVAAAWNRIQPIGTRRNEFCVIDSPWDSDTLAFFVRASKSFLINGRTTSLSITRNRRFEPRQRVLQTRRLSEHYDRRSER